MTFRKTVLAYLTGWLIVQPAFAAAMRWVRKRDIEQPSDEMVVYWRRQAEAIVAALEREARR